jgi:predicted nucleic acid-binding protein
LATFVDTSALYAVLDAADPNHAAASAAWRRLIDEREPLVTTSYVMVETVGLVQSRHGFAPARRVMEDVAPAFDIVWIDAALHATAVAAWLAAARGSLSLVDCASFAAMRLRGIRQAFAFDEHFVEQGFARVS